MFIQRMIFIYNIQVSLSTQVYNENCFNDKLIMIVIQFENNVYIAFFTFSRLYTYVAKCLYCSCIHTIEL